MITTEFLEKIVLKLTYVRKEGTKTSYYREDGCNYLPKRMSISREALSKIKIVGRAAVYQKKGSFIGKFRANEYSQIKIVDNGVVRGTIWGYPDNPHLFGYSDLGFTNEQGIIQEGFDLIIFRKISDCLTTVEIVVFKGCYAQRERIMSMIK